MSIYINHNYAASGNDFDTYTVTIDGFSLKAVVTSNSNVVSDWICTTESIHDRHCSSIVVGLDVEWRPSFTSGVTNPIATIQLCINNRCLVYQILQSKYRCPDLYRFLGQSGYKFVGVGIEQDAEKLMRNYELNVCDMVDLRHVAANETGNKWMRYNTGLKALANHVLDMNLAKPRRITLSDWDDEELSMEQVMYAVADAYVSYKLGTVLKAYQYK